MDREQEWRERHSRHRTAVYLSYITCIFQTHYPSVWEEGGCRDREVEGGHIKSLQVGRWGVGVEVEEAT